MTLSLTLRAALVALPLLIISAPLAPAGAETQGVIAVVNDQPITERDLTERIALLTILGDAGREPLTRKAALRSLIDEQVKITEATKFKMMPTDAEMKEQITRMSKGMDTTPDGMVAKLKKQGVSETAFRKYVSALIGFNRIISSKFRSKITVDDAEIDAKFAEIKGKMNSEVARIMKDPRMKPITVYSLMEVILPVEGNDAMLLQARAVEANQVKQRLKGCGNVRAAAEGVFNVKQGKKFEADAAKMPKAMRSALENAGTGGAIGPMRGKSGIQLLVLCGTRKLTPPKPDFKMPTREQVERSVQNDKYDDLEEQYLKTIRGNVYIEYRNPNYAQQ